MTVQDMIHASFRIAGINIAPGRGESASQLQEGLDTANTLLDAWRTESLMVYAISQDVYTLTPHLNPHTIGSGGDFFQERPVRIEDIYLRYTAQPTQPVDTRMIPLRTWEDYAVIAVKTIESPIPQRFYYQPNYPLGNVFFWPVANTAYEVVIYAWTVLNQLPSLASTFAMPPGYRRMLEYNLAVELAVRYPKRMKTGDPIMFQNALRSMEDVKVVNAVPLEMASDPAAAYRAGVWDWRLGSWRP